MSVQALLDSLRWEADMVITNHEGERVWLTECHNESGVQIGITDCCFAADPCDYHGALDGSIRAEVIQ
jgi:hypothetical protein